MVAISGGDAQRVGRSRRDLGEIVEHGGTCGGTTASLPQFTESVFGDGPACLSEQELNDTFATAPVVWTVPVSPPLACGGGAAD